MHKADGVRLRHMLESAREAMSFAQNLTRRDLGANRMPTLALTRLIEIIGKAAAKISLETRTHYATIPWADIVGMRNRLIHAYFDVDLDRLWDTITDDLPPLVAELEKTLASER